MKRLLPEVLPAPSATPAERPRARAIRRLQSIAKTAVGSATCLSLCYCVVDMSPPPASCNDSSDWTASVVVTGTWQPPEPLRLELVVAAWWDTPLGDPEVAGGTIESNDNGVIVIRVDPDATQVEVTLDATCQGDRRTLHAVIAVPADPVSGEAASVTVNWGS